MKSVIYLYLSKLVLLNFKLGLLNEKDPKVLGKYVLDVEYFPSSNLNFAFQKKQLDKESGSKDGNHKSLIGR